MKRHENSRRAFLAGTAAVLATPALSQTSSYSTPFENSTEVERDPNEVVRHNISSFRSLDWQPYFSNTRNGAILVDIDSRALHYWSEDQSIYKLYPTSVPLTEELTRKGRTTVIQKVVAPTWRPTPNMRERNPEWPAVVEGGADDAAALFLS